MYRHCKLICLKLCYRPDRSTQRAKQRVFPAMSRTGCHEKPCVGLVKMYSSLHLQTFSDEHASLRMQQKRLLNGRGV